MRLHNNLNTDLIKTDLDASRLEDVLKEIIAHLKFLGLINNEKQIIDKLLERERLGTTAIGNHAAVPHTKLKDIKKPIIFIGISKKGIQYKENDKDLIHLVILILSPSDSPIIHLQILAAAASLIKKSPDLIDEARSCNSSELFMNIIKKYETMND